MPKLNRGEDLWLAEIMFEIAAYKEYGSDVDNIEECKEFLEELQARSKRKDEADNFTAQNKKDINKSLEIINEIIENRKEQEKKENLEQRRRKKESDQRKYALANSDILWLTEIDADIETDIIKSYDKNKLEESKEFLEKLQARTKSEKEGTLIKRHIEEINNSLEVIHEIIENRKKIEQEKNLEEERRKKESDQKRLEFDMMEKQREAKSFEEKKEKQEVIMPAARDNEEAEERQNSKLQIEKTLMELHNKFINFGELYSKRRSSSSKLKTFLGSLGQRASRPGQIARLESAIDALRLHPNNNQLKKLKDEIAIVEQEIIAEQKSKSYKLGPSDLSGLLQDLKNEIRETEDKIVPESRASMKSPRKE